MRPVTLARRQTLTRTSVTTISLRTTATGTTLPPGAMPAGTYTWRAVPIDASGNPLTAWSPDHTFTLP